VEFIRIAYTQDCLQSRESTLRFQGKKYLKGRGVAVEKHERSRPPSPARAEKLGAKEEKQVGLLNLLEWYRLPVSSVLQQVCDWGRAVQMETLLASSLYGIYWRPEGGALLLRHAATILAKDIRLSDQGFQYGRLVALCGCRCGRAFRARHRASPAAALTTRSSGTTVGGIVVS
jgi:hypothetical protein